MDSYPDGDEGIIERAKDRFREIADFESSQRDEMKDDKDFVLGENNAQWDDNDVRSRELTGRPFITIMRVNQFTDHIKNQSRQNKISIKISPTDDGANEVVAERRQGLIRHIQYDSKASQARQHGFDDAVDMGRGHWIVKTEFVEGTFVQKIVVEPIKNPRSVYMDIKRERPDYSDCEFGFVLKDIPRKDFEEKYPDCNGGWSYKDEQDWSTLDTVTVAEYYMKSEKERTLIEVEIDGATRVLYEDELEDVKAKDLNIINKRKVTEPEWKWYKLTNEKILDQEDLPWKEIPIITVVGKEDVVEGQLTLKGLTRDIKQPLRLYNFATSSEAEIIAKAPRAPWIMAEGQDEDYEDEWANSNISDVAVLHYKNNMRNDGSFAPPPQRAQYSVDLSMVQQQKMNCIEDIKAVTGIYDASVGNRSNETSGVAIRAREAQGNAANFHFVDNLSMAINHEGRVINSALPVIYDTERTITIMGDDEEEELIAINNPDDPGLGTGNFSVTVSTGPSNNTQREEQAQGMMEMLSNVPLVQEVASDLVVRTQDWVGKDALADRLEFATDMKYQGITKQQKPDSEDDEVALLQGQLQQAQGQLQQMGQQAQQLQQALEKSNADKNAADAGKIQVDMQKLEIERQKVQIEAQKVQGELQIKEKELEMDAMKADLDAETKMKMNTDNNEVELIKTAQTSQEQPKVDAPKVAPVKPPVQNVEVVVQGSKVKKSVVKKTENGDYEVTTVEGDDDKTSKK